MHLSTLATQKTTTYTTKTTSQRRMLPNEIGTLPGKTAIKPGNRPQTPKCASAPKSREKSRNASNFVDYLAKT
jgi:hypothetical protein